MPPAHGIRGWELRVSFRSINYSPRPRRGDPSIDCSGDAHLAHLRKWRTNQTTYEPHKKTLERKQYVLTISTSHYKHARVLMCTLKRTKFGKRRIVRTAPDDCKKKQTFVPRKRAKIAGTRQSEPSETPGSGSSIGRYATFGACGIAPK